MSTEPSQNENEKCKEEFPKLSEGIWRCSFEDRYKFVQNLSIQNMPWGLYKTEPETLNPFFYSIRLDDIQQKPNDGSQLVPIYMEIVVRPYEHIEGYVFGFSKVYAFIDLDNPASLKLEFNRDYWRNGKDYRDAQAKLYGNYVELKTHNTLKPLDDQYDLKNTPVAVISSVTNHLPLPKISARLDAHIVNMLILKEPDNIELDDAKRVLIKKIVDKSISAKKCIQKNRRFTDAVTLSSYTASVNCGVKNEKN